MEEHTYVPVVLKYYFDFNKLKPFTMLECLDTLYNTRDAEAFVDGASLALDTLLEKMDKNGMLTNYEIMIVDLEGKLTLEEAKEIINANKDDNAENIMHNFKVKQKIIPSSNETDEKE